MEKKVNIRFSRDGVTQRLFKETDLKAAFMLVEYEFGYGGRVDVFNFSKAPGREGCLLEVVTPVMGHKDRSEFFGLAADMRHVIEAVGLHAQVHGDGEAMKLAYEIAHRITGGIPLLVACAGLMEVGKLTSSLIMTTILGLNEEQTFLYRQMEKRDREFVIDAVELGYSLGEVFETAHKKQ